MGRMVTLPAVLLPHRITKESPAYLLYGRELRGPSDAILDTRGLLPASRQFAESTMKRLRVAWHLAEAATLKEQMSDKSRVCVLTFTHCSHTSCEHLSQEVCTCINTSLRRCSYSVNTSAQEVFTHPY